MRRRKLRDILERARSCEKRGCPRHRHRDRQFPVDSHGNFDAEVMLIGLDPGKQSLRESRPWFGPSGRLLREAIGKLGRELEELYLTDLVKCYSEDGAERRRCIKFCEEYLNQEIEILNPEYAIALGGDVWRFLCRRFEASPQLPRRITQVHNRQGWKVFELGKLRVIPLQHPARPRMRRELYAQHLKRVFGRVLNPLVEHDRQRAVDCYLLWEFSKRQIWCLLDSGQPLDVVKDRIEKKVLPQAKARMRSLSLQDKIKHVRRCFPTRAEYFRRFHWRREDYRIDKLGTVLPECGDFPPQIISKSLRCVVEFVKQSPCESLESVRYIRELAKIADLLKKHFPIIIVEPGKLQRSRDKMAKFWGSWDQHVEEMDGYIEDGNHRAIAMIIADESLETLPAFVGKGMRICERSQPY